MWSWGPGWPIIPLCVIKKCRTGVAQRILIILHQRALWSLFVRLTNRMYIHVYVLKNAFVAICLHIYVCMHICYSCNYKITWPYICNFNWTDPFFSLFVFITFPESVILHMNISNIMYIYSYDNQTCVSFLVCCRAVDWYCASFPI